MFGPSGHLDYGSATLRCKIYTLHPGTIQRKDGIQFCHLATLSQLACIVSLVSRLTIRIQAQAIESGGRRSLVGQIAQVEHRFADSSAPLVDAVVSTSILAFVV